MRWHIQVTSSGDIHTNGHEIYLKNVGADKSGIGYNAFGSPELCLFSKNFIEIRRPGNGALVAQCSVIKDNESVPYFNLYGRVTMEKWHWTGGLCTDTLRFAGFEMASFMPASHWYGTLGSSSKRFGAAYIDHAYINVYTTYPSDEKVKENVRSIENGLSKVMQLRPVSYDIKESFYDSIVEKDAKQYAMGNGGKNRIGFISQEVQKVMPELVSEEPQSGLLGINTIDMIPYLVQAIKEQQATIEKMEQEIEKLQSETKTYELKSTSLHTAVAHTNEVALLSQNKPNPFTASTKIEMFVPSNVSNAMLYVYDLQGKQVKSMVVSGRGATSETILGNELQVGMYIYSLVTDGKLVGSKQMVLTE